VLINRGAENSKRMRSNGVIIDESPPQDLSLALHDAAATSVANWRTKVGPEGQQLLDDNLRRLGHIL